MQTIIIADDHPMTLKGIQLYVENLNYKVLNTYLNGIDAYEGITDLKPEVVKSCANKELVAIKAKAISKIFFMIFLNKLIFIETKLLYEYTLHNKGQPLFYGRVSSNYLKKILSNLYTEQDFREN